jgi:hypothetical protein
VIDDGTHIRPPSANDAWLLASVGGGLASELGLAQRLHPAYLGESDDARAVLAWLSKRGAFGDPADAVGVLRRLAGIGKAGRRLTKPMTDEQLRALRDGFERLAPGERAELGLGVGRAIKIRAYWFTEQRRKVFVDAAPAETYLPRAIDRDPDSFALAALDTPGLLWADGHYAHALRSPHGRLGLGAQRFLRLLGAETAPRVIDHPGLQVRFASERRRGLHRSLPGNPPGRAEAMTALGARYTLEDKDSPDLIKVLSSIGNDRKATRRRQRAAAMLATLGRAWDRLADIVEVDAANDYYGWNYKGVLRAVWLWRAAAIPWLDDNTATPRPPDALRLRTPSTVAVHGPGAAGYVHWDIPVQRLDVLAALGVSGEPSTGDLVNRLQALRDAPAEGDDVATDAALIYRGLADRLSSRRHIAGDLTLGNLRQAFAAGSGLVLTNLGWRPPSRVLAGTAVFGDRRAFVPAVPGTERLWSTLHIRPPSVGDCAAVLGGLARAGTAPGAAEQAITLDTLRLLSELLSTEAPPPAARRRLARLPVWTSQGWHSTRPVYAVDDPTLAAGLADRVPVWQPGGELDQFRDLLDHLGLTELAAESATVVRQIHTALDEEATDLFHRAVPLLREDLARNDPKTAGALQIGWDRLTTFEVRVAAELRVRVDGLPAGVTSIIPVEAKTDPDNSALYLRDGALLPGVGGGGRAIAGLFAADRRRVAQAWLAACEAARAGRDAEQLQLAEERAAQDRERTEADIATRLAAFSAQTAAAHARGRAWKGTTATTPAAAPAAPGPSDTSALVQRVLVDPSRLRVADPQGRLVDHPVGQPPGTEPRRSSGKAPKELPEPKPGGGPPHHTAAPPSYTAGTKESVGLELVRKVLASDADEMRDLRAQHGVGADAVDQLDRFFELKVYAGAEPDVIRLEESQIRRAMTTPDFFLVVVSHVEGEKAKPKVRVIAEPFRQLHMTETSSVSLTGVRTSQSLVYDLVTDE